MNDIIYKLRYFLSIGLLFIFICTITSLLSNKINLHLWLNSYHNHWLDTLFANITWIGDGAFALLLLPYLIPFVEFRTFLISLFSCLLAGGLAQIFKKLIFMDSFRPGKLIPEEQLYLIDGIQLHDMYSFPSGHTTSAFALFTLLAFFNRKNIPMQWFFALAAVLVAYSRVYLSQHFLEDIAFGGILGIVSFLISFQIMQTFKFNRLDQPLFDWIFERQEKILNYKKGFRTKFFSHKTNA